MKASDLMSRDLYYVAPATSIACVAKAMNDYGLSCLPVMSGKRVIGIITASELGLKGHEPGIDHSTAIRKIMSREVAFCESDAGLERICELMLLCGVGRLIVLDRSGVPTGMLTLADLAPALTIQALGTLVRALKMGPMYVAAASSAREASKSMDTRRAGKLRVLDQNAVHPLRAISR